MAQQTYTVKPGQSRSQIASELGVSVNQVGTGRSGNPNLIFPGEQLTVGSSSTGTPTQGGTNIPTIPASVGLGNTPQVNLPQFPTTSQSATQLSGASAGFMALPAINSAKSLESQLQEQANITAQNAQTSQQDYQSGVLQLLNQMQNRPGELESQYNVRQLSEDALKAKANYDAVELDYRRQKEATTTNPMLSAEQKNARIAEISRKEASQKADIAIDYNLKSGLLSNAKELMQKQLELEIEPMKLKVDYYKTLKDDYGDMFTSAQNRQLDYITKKEERAYQSAQKANDAKQRLIEKAIDNGMYTSDMKGMSYGQLAEKIGQGVGGIYLNQYSPGTSGYTQGLLLSSGKNKKALTEGQITKIEKAKSAVAQLQNVEALMKDAKTGAFRGRFNKFLTKFGGAPDAYAAQAALTGLIPTLARGVYGEVGVLTDSDISLYKQTVPNLTSSKSQNNLVQAVTLKTIQSGLRNQLETLARGGYDVAQFAEDYDQFSKNILSIEDRIIDNNGDSVTKKRVVEMVKQNPAIQPIIEQAISEGKTYSDILVILGEY